MFRSIALLTLLAAANAEARYVKLAPENLEPLSARVPHAFVTATNVRQAATLVLDRTGYRLAADHIVPQRALLELPLPTVHKDLAGLSALSALIVLSKPGYRVVVDHVNRIVGFEPRPRYAGYRVAQSSVSSAQRVPANDWDCQPTANGQFRCVAVQS
jgi:conjugative transfer region protein (TIGR03748 family)